MSNDSHSTYFKQRMEELTKANEQKRLAQLQQQYITPPDYTNMSLRDELKTRLELQEMDELQKKYGQQQYGDATAQKLDKYISGYKYPQGKVTTGLIAPINDMIRNYKTMKNMKLKESDPFFHCKANYEAASRGAYGTAVANVIDVGKELFDNIINKYPIEDSLRDYRANLKGQIGAWKGQTLQEACPTHHKYYK